MSRTGTGLAKCELFARPPKDNNLYYDADVTPYIHALAYHVPDLFDRHGLGLMQFSCFAGEKQNHLRASQFFKQTSHGGGKKKKTPVEQLFAVQLRCTFNPFVRGLPEFRCGVVHARAAKTIWGTSNATTGFATRRTHRHARQLVSTNKQSIFRQKFVLRSLVIKSGHTELKFQSGLNHSRCLI